MRIETLKPDLFDAYDAHVAGAPAASVYHTRAWLAFLGAEFSVLPRTLVAVGTGGEIVGALPLAERRRLLGRSLESLPFSHRVPPLGAPEVAAELVAAARRLALAEKLPLVLRGVGEENAIPARFVNTSLDLAADEAGLLKHIREATQQQLRQALRNEAMSLRLATRREDFAAMDAVMAENRRMLGSATYRVGFFETLSRKMGPALRMELCEADGKVIAMFVSSVHSREAIYHYGASSADPATRRLRPNNLLCWSALRHAVASGARRFDFGTSLPSQEGLVRFKEGWGGLTAPLPTLAYDRAGSPAAHGISQEGAVARLAGRVIAKLPLRLYRLVTPPLAREFG
jgi:CelD/BcsL family acetyltransferase involved in cellulose biosynthesis